MHSFLRSLFPAFGQPGLTSIGNINRLRAAYASHSDAELRSICHKSEDPDEVIAVTAVVAKRVLGLDMFDVQLRGALSLVNGRIAEMQTRRG